MNMASSNLTMSIANLTKFISFILEIAFYLAKNWDRRESYFKAFENLKSACSESNNQMIPDQPCVGIHWEGNSKFSTHSPCKWNSIMSPIEDETIADA